MNRWGRNYGRSRKCGRRRTTPFGTIVRCSRVDDGSHDLHRGADRPLLYGDPARHWSWVDGGPVTRDPA